MILEEWIPRAQSGLLFPELLIQKDGQRRRRTGQESVEDHFQAPFDFFNGAEEVLMNPARCCAAHRQPPGQDTPKARSCPAQVRPAGTG